MEFEDYIEWICDPTLVNNEKCSVCMTEFRMGDFECVKLNKCKAHYFHESCIKTWLKHKSVCPYCNTPYGLVTGDQPEGTMTHNTSSSNLPGYNDCGTITIIYNIPNGIQNDNHPNPNTRYTGTQRVCYLPDNDEGNKVLKLMKQAFKQKLIFTVGTSLTTGASNVVKWNGIHHKTSINNNFGYPDPGYIDRVLSELKSKGIN